MSPKKTDQKIEATALELALKHIKQLEEKLTALESENKELRDRINSIPEVEVDVSPVPVDNTTDPSSPSFLPKSKSFEAPKGRSLEKSKSGTLHNRTRHCV
jgi:hypothetical protein